MVFEQPLTERVRTFLRLEFLFAEYSHHARSNGPFAMRARIRALLDVLALTARSDLKSEVIKEVQDQQTALARTPQALVGLDAKTVNEQLRDVLKGVQRQPTHFAGASLRAHEFLDTLSKRGAIPGGAAPFDLPAVHRWLHQPDAVLAEDANKWFEHFAAYEAAIAICLNSLRHAGQTEQLQASNGVHLHMPKAAHQLLRVWLPAGSMLYPEISAGRHRYSLRFMAQGQVDSRAQQASGAVAFGLQCCALAP